MFSLLKYLLEILNQKRNGLLSGAQKMTVPLTSTSNPVNRITLRRNSPVNDSISGTVTFGNETMVSLERKGVEIPCGTYAVVMTYSPDFGRDLPELVNVPSRTSIRIHSGNTPSDSKGCILVGKSSTPDKLGIVDSRTASDHLNEWINAHLPCEIEIKSQ